MRRDKKHGDRGNAAAQAGGECEQDFLRKRPWSYVLAIPIKTAIKATTSKAAETATVVMSRSPQSPSG